MDRMSPAAASGGLTLTELLIVLVILSITALATAPSMQQLVQGNRIRSQAARLADAINLARSEAVLRTQPVSLCPSSMAATGEPACAGRYADGWIVFANPGRDRVVDAGSDEVIRAFRGLPPGYTLTNRTGTRVADRVITYLPDGSSRSNRTLLVCAPGAVVPPWSVVLNRVGRARLSQGEGQCPA